MTDRWLPWLLHAWTGIVLSVGVAAAIDGGPEARVPRIGAGVDAAAAATPPSSMPSLPAGTTTQAADSAEAQPSPSSAAETGAFVSVPVAVEAEAVGIDAPLVAVGKTPDGALAVPDFGNAGWYENSVRPGERGAAVLAGHVDSTTGPDVFYALRDLEPGDEVTVRRRDGTAVTFFVQEVETTDKDELPIARIFTDTASPSLRLITCGGAFDRSARSYDSNVIVYAGVAPTGAAPLEG